MTSQYVNARCSRWYGWLVFTVVFMLHGDDLQAMVRLWQVLFPDYTWITNREKNNMKENTALGLHTSRTIRIMKTEI